ncbi:MAG: NAD(P)/FAD-dependent oxidoreductase [Natronomonas sp.]
MADDVVVVGSGYVGTGTIQRLESELDSEADLTWISDVDHHFVLHESHRIIRDPSVGPKITFPIESLKSPATRFVEGRVVEIDVDTRELVLEDGSIVPFDYLVVGIGSRTAYFGIEGVKRNASTVKNLEDVLEIHNDLERVSQQASRSDPAQVVVGGAGLSGIQSAGEIAAFRDEKRAPIEIHLVEGLDSVFPNNDPVVQATLRELLEAKEVRIHTGEFIGEVDEDTVYGSEDLALEYDVLLWTGGITGHEVATTADVDQQPRTNRLEVSPTFQTSHERIFALGDAALVEQPTTNRPVPPTAQAAWQAAEVAATNVARSIREEPIEPWVYRDMGTVISVGDDAVANDVVGVRAIKETVTGPFAEQLKKAAALRWIRKITGPAAALRAYPYM